MHTTSLIYKVLSGEADESEKKELDVWLAQSEENKIEFNDIELLWRGSTDADRSLSEKPFRKGLTKIKALMQSRLKQREREKRTRVILLLLSGALIALLFFLFPSRHQEPAGPLTFTHATLEQVIETLEHDYPVRIELEDPRIKACTFTGIFYHVKNVDEILHVLDESLHLSHYPLGEGRYLIRGSGCAGIP
jgi:ferric-dicitrate binding protein FerR (iron transport regulator)